MPSQKNPSWWPTKLNPEIKKFCCDLKENILDIFKQETRYTNITCNELKALSDLKQDKNIIIKKADKNAGIVIMNTTDYINKIQNLLSDSDIYTELNIDNTHSIKIESDKILYELYRNNYLTIKQLKNLTNYNPTSPVFHGIPKIHKPNVPLRPTVSQINGPTYNINKYLHELLLVSESVIPYLFKDTTAFLNTIERHKYISATTYLVT